MVGPWAHIFDRQDEVEYRASVGSDERNVEVSMSRTKQWGKSYFGPACSSTEHHIFSLSTEGGKRVYSITERGTTERVIDNGNGTLTYQEELRTKD